jgi:surface carbohydrate biosynthesis protein
MASNARPHLIIPSEVQVREFDSKLLLACLAAERGYRSVVGSRIEIHNRITSLPRGIYLAKDAAATSCKMFTILRNLGVPILAWDEEAIIYYDVGQFLRKRVCDCTIKRTERYLTWGEEQRQELAATPLFADVPLEPTGNPRIDMLRPELRAFFDDEVAELRRRFGRFVLINTNFGRLNHFLAEKKLTPSAPGEEARRNLAPNDIALEIWRFRDEIFRAFQEMLPALARALPDIAVVLRPHPAEQPAFWAGLAQGLPNVHVLHEGSVIPWLLAAEVTIHNGCTTGLEAYLLDRPVIAYRPVQDPARELMLPNDLSRSVASIDELVAAVREVLEGRHNFAPTPATLAALKARLAGLEGPLVGERVLDVVDRMVAAGGDKACASLPQRLEGWRKGLARRATKALQAYMPWHKNSASNRRHRFPGITVEEVTARIDRLGRCLGRFQAVAARPLAPNVFEITPR